MLNPPVTDRKNQAESTNSATLAEHERQHQTVNWSGRFSGTRDRPDVETIQQAYGNQAALRMLQSQKSPVMNPLQGGVLQRKCACGNATVAAGTCAECQEKQEMMLQRKAAGSEAVGEVPAIVHEVLRSPGQPLDRETRTFMESRFGYDFSQVRIHQDLQADESAKAVNALAYTVGHNIVLGSGQYAPTIAKGKQLLAHELTHVVQQSNDASRHSQIVPTFGDSSAVLEQEADYIANRISQGQVAPAIQQNTNLTIQLQVDPRYREILEHMSNQELNQELENVRATLRDLTDVTDPEWSALIEQERIILDVIANRGFPLPEPEMIEDSETDTGSYAHRLEELEQDIEDIRQEERQQRCHRLREEGQQYGYTMSEAASAVLAHNELPAADDWERMPENWQPFIQRHPNGQWQLIAPPISVHRSSDISCHVEGINAGLDDYAAIEEFWGPIAETLQAVALALSTSAAGQAGMGMGGGVPVTTTSSPPRLSLGRAGRSARTSSTTYGQSHIGSSVPRAGTSPRPRTRASDAPRTEGSLAPRRALDPDIEPAPLRGEESGIFQIPQSESAPTPRSQTLSTPRDTPRSSPLPRVITDPSMRERSSREDESLCRLQPVDHPSVGGFADRHNQYAHHVGQVKGYPNYPPTTLLPELLVTTPSGERHQYDVYNALNYRDVWEVKTRHEWLSNIQIADAPLYRSYFESRIRSLSAQLDSGKYVATRCGLNFRYSFDICDMYLAFFAQFGGDPLVAYIPFPGETRVPCNPNEEIL